MKANVGLKTYPFCMAHICVRTLRRTCSLRRNLLIYYILFSTPARVSNSVSCHSPLIFWMQPKFEYMSSELLQYKPESVLNPWCLIRKTWNLNIERLLSSTTSLLCILFLLILKFSRIFEERTAVLSITLCNLVICPCSLH